ncbi:hypothetical protein BsWGS_23845 [Bradybaena similaris]
MPLQICTCGGNYLFCNDKNLDAIPEEVATKNPVITNLNMDDNQIRFIRTGSLPANLTLITIQGSPIESIDDDAFDESLNTLQSLHFCGARFSQIPAAVLNLRNLITLSICQTNIGSWDVNGMKRLGSTMVTLDLDTVGLSEWPTWLEYFIHLTELQLSGGSISSLPEDALDMVADTLVTLELQNNSLTSVPKAISKLTCLQTLSLQENKITDLTWLPQLSKLTNLLLNNNRLTNATILSNALRVYNSTLYSVTLNANFLTAIPDLWFLTQLQSIDLTNNHISDVNSGGFPVGISDVTLGSNLLRSIPMVMKYLNYVSKLKLNANRISAIQGWDFPPATDGADFGYNLITAISKSCFPANSRISFIVLSYNPISQISTDAFDNVPHLMELSIQHSKLTRLPMAVASLSLLNYFDVSDSANLVCTCLEKQLESRISAMMADNVVGNCGPTSIYFFFTQLSHDCPSYLL